MTKNTEANCLAYSEKNGYIILVLFIKGSLHPFKYELTNTKENEIVVKIVCCGICHSDVHAIESGPSDNSPCVPGHEIIGHVVSKGAKAEKFKVGDRVGVGAMAYACLECDLCKGGFDNLCKKRVFTYNGKYADGSKSYGGYADHIKVNENWAFTIPESFSDEIAAPLLCAGTTVFAPLRKYLTKPGMRVGIIGIGGLGHLAVQFAAKMGAKVTCISTSASKVEESKKLGATDFYNVNDATQHDKFKMHFDLLLKTSSGGVEEISNQLGMLRPNGVLVLLGIPSEKMKLSAFEFVGQHRTITGSLVGSIKDVEDMYKFAAEHDVKPWITVMKMADVNQGNMTFYHVIVRS